MSERLDRIERIQESNARAITALTEAIAENGRQITQTRAELTEVANDFYRVAGEHVELITQNNTRIERILEYLGNRNGGSNPPQ